LAYVRTPIHIVAAMNRMMAMPMRFMRLGCFLERDTVLARV